MQVVRVYFLNVLNRSRNLIRSTLVKDNLTEMKQKIHIYGIMLILGAYYCQHLFIEYLY